VETEQLVEISGGKGGVISSFVQIRGSIPLLWSQVPNIKYKPTTRLAPKSAYQPAFDRHVADIVNSYKVPPPQPSPLPIRHTCTAFDQARHLNSEICWAVQ
jgi:hypothetical protein